MPGREYAPLLHLARALSDRVVNRRARVHQHVLQVSLHAGRKIREAFAGFTVTRCTKAGEIELRGLYVAGAVAVFEGQTAGFNDHLEECVVPADAEPLAVAHVFDTDCVESAV